MENFITFGIIVFLIGVSLINLVLIKKVQSKENLLKFADIEREQAKEDRKVAEKELEIAYQRIEVLNNGNKTLIESRDHWKERALHKKHTANKVVDSENWKCINQHYLNFNNGFTYKKDLLHTPIRDSLLSLIGDDNESYLVEKKYFQPVN